ncbi:MAG: UDP-N-acetylmuramate dehydrogenase [Prevotella sp.]|nr:UDP-N-acetylmuramate dehydrogenase [Prevotella sp.]
MKDYNHYDLLRHNTFGIAATCSRYLEYETVEEARQVASLLRTSKHPLLIIGGGSNLLLTCDFEGIVVRSGVKGIVSLSPLQEESAKEEALLRCGSGETWDDVVAFAVNNGFYGMENLSLIPGEVGASAVQNIGAYGAEVGDLIVSIEAVEIATGEAVTIRREECGYGYRQSRFKGEWKNRYLITHVTYRLSTTFEPRLDYGNIRAALAEQGIDTPSAVQLRQTIIDIRNAKLPDPKVQGNGGSFFMNPVVDRAKYEQLAALYPGMPHYMVDAEHEKIPAGWMIEQCGWKGRSLGRAGVHDRQALVLVNRGGATGQEVVTLCETIRRDVREKFGIDIHPEVNIV